MLDENARDKSTFWFCFLTLFAVLSNTPTHYKKTFMFALLRLTNQPVTKTSPSCWFKASQTVFFKQQLFNCLPIFSILLHRRCSVLYRTVHFSFTSDRFNTDKRISRQTHHWRQPTPNKCTLFRPFFPVSTTIKPPATSLCLGPYTNQHSLTYPDTLFTTHPRSLLVSLHQSRAQIHSGTRS